MILTLCRWIRKDGWRGLSKLLYQTTCQEISEKRNKTTIGYQLCKDYTSQSERSQDNGTAMRAVMPTTQIVQNFMGT